jgi:hypothetical protein
MRVCVVRDARGPEGCTQGVGPGVILICAVAADWAGFSRIGGVRC